MQGLRAGFGSDYRYGMKNRTLSPAAAAIFGFSLMSACGLADRVMGRSPEAVATAGSVAPLPDGPLSASEPLGGAQSAAAFDQSTEADLAAANAAPDAGAERALGAVVVALGSPAEQGFWLRSALVTAPAKGRVMTAAGKTVNVDLQPGTGAALLSLAAYRALGLGLTDLPEVQVFANPG